MICTAFVLIALMLCSALILAYVGIACYRWNFKWGFVVAVVTPTVRGECFVEEFPSLAVLLPPRFICLDPAKTA